MSRGFTLVELVVALALAALAAALLFDGARVATRTLERLETRREAQDSLVATRLVARELDRARRLSGRSDGLRFLAPAPPRFGGGAYLFSLATTKDADGLSLVLSFAREAGGAERNGPDGAERRAVLARRLRFVQFDYLAEPPPGLPYEWRSRWDARDGLPRAVRVTLGAQAAGSAPSELYFTPRLTGIRPEPPA